MAFDAYTKAPEDLRHDHTPCLHLVDVGTLREPFRDWSQLGQDDKGIAEDAV